MLAILINLFIDLMLSCVVMRSIKKPSSLYGILEYVNKWLKLLHSYYFIVGRRVIVYYIHNNAFHSQ